MDRNDRQLPLCVPRINEVADYSILQNEHVSGNSERTDLPPGGNDEQPVMNCITDFRSSPSRAIITLRNLVKPGLQTPR